jgi:hypothetical protein
MAAPSHVTSTVEEKLDGEDNVFADYVLSRNLDSV